MKLAILGDTHFGMRGDSPAFHQYYRKFYEQVFFPTLAGRGIERVIQVGDLFDRRKFINFNSLHMSKDYFFNRFNESLNLISIVGNHDAFYKNTLAVNSQRLLLNDYKSLGYYRCIESPTTMRYQGVDIDFIPWICRDNEQEIRDFIKASTSEICVGHFEIVGFEMDAGNPCTVGMDRKELEKYKMVLSGHFHHRSSDGNIHYIGSPGEMTWADYDESRGFHIFDTETFDLEFIENPFRMHNKVGYDDTVLTMDDIYGLDFRHVTDTYVKVLVEHKDEPVIFDAFIAKLYEARPLDVNIVEDAIQETSPEQIINATDTPTLIDKYIDNINTNIDVNRMKQYMQTIYKEAVHSGSSNG